MEDGQKAAEILRLIDSVHSTLNHANLAGLTVSQHHAWLDARSTAWQAHEEMVREISLAKDYGESPIARAYAAGIPTTLLFLRDHPGLPGKRGASIVAQMYKARELLGTYPEGFEAWRNSPEGKAAYAGLRRE